MRIAFGCSLAACVMCVAIMGCSGGGDEPALINRQGDAELTDSDTKLRNMDAEFRITEIPADLVEVTPRVDGWLTVTMTGQTLEDPFVLVRLGSRDDFDDKQNVAWDDDSGPGLWDARAVFRVSAGTTYTIAFTTALNRSYGTYSYSIIQTTAQPASVAAATEVGDKGVEALVESQLVP